VFLDLESDPYVGEHGLEYLFGYQFRNEAGDWVYNARWALTRDQEKGAFEEFIDFVMKRWEKYPDLHVYHYGGWPAPGFEDTEFGVFMEPGGGSWRDGSSRGSSSLRLSS
jgi:hypothetical protein